MALQKNSPLTPFLGKSVKQLLDSGLLSRIIDKHYRNIGDTSTCDTTPEKSLSLKKLVIVFMVFICGIVLSLLGMCFEYLYEKVWTSQENQRKMKSKTKERSIV